MFITRKQLTITNYPECVPVNIRTVFRLPKGTELLLIKNADGIRGDLYAVASTQLLISLTGNDHDPVYRYCFIDARHVIEATPRDLFKRWQSACRSWVHWCDHKTASRAVGEFPYMINGKRAEAVYWGIGWTDQMRQPPRMQLDRRQDRGTAAIPRREFDSYIVAPKPAGREFRRLEIASFARHRAELKNRN